MSHIKFFRTPLASVFCATCKHWEGARIIKDGHLHTGAGFLGYCASPSFDPVRSKTQEIPMPASNTDCNDWMPITPE